jgi:hypothetical protein
MCTPCPSVPDSRGTAGRPRTDPRLVRTDPGTRRSMASARSPRSCIWYDICMRCVVCGDVVLLDFALGTVHRLNGKPVGDDGRPVQHRRLRNPAGLRTPSSPADPNEIERLLDAEAYRAHTEQG